MSKIVEFIENLLNSVKSRKQRLREYRNKMFTLKDRLMEHFAKMHKLKAKK